MFNTDFLRMIPLLYFIIGLKFCFSISYSKWKLEIKNNNNFQFWTVNTGDCFFSHGIGLVRIAFWVVY